MEKNKLFLLSNIFCIILLLASNINISAQENYDPKNNNGKKWRIGYIESGDSKKEYEQSLKGLAEGLMNFGWIMKDDNIIREKGSAAVWSWLAKSKSDYIEFVHDAYWESGGDEDEKIKENNELIKKRKDIDLIIAMGTMAGEYIVKSNINTNTIIMGASNPVESNLVVDKKNQKYSGRSNIHVLIESDRYKNQIIFFAQELKMVNGSNLKKIGVVYRDSPNGRAFAALNDMRAQERDTSFKIVPCPIPATWPREKLVAKVKECYDELAPKIDAMYMTSHLDVKKEDICSLIKPMLKHNVPVWSQIGEDEVEYGALMGFDRATSAFDAGFFFEAEVVAKILRRDAEPGDINQIFYSPVGKKIALNLRTAQRIKFNPSWNALAAAEHVFETIKTTKPGEDCDE